MQENEEREARNAKQVNYVVASYRLCIYYGEEGSSTVLVGAHHHIKMDDVEQHLHWL